MGGITEVITPRIHIHGRELFYQNQPFDYLRSKARGC
jgi:hypothetical protein